MKPVVRHSEALLAAADRVFGPEFMDWFLKVSVFTCLLCACPPRVFPGACRHDHSAAWEPLRV